MINYKKNRICTTCRRWFQKLQQGDIPAEQLKIPKLKRWQNKPVGKTVLVNINRLEVALECDIFPKDSDTKELARLLLDDLKARTETQKNCAQMKEARKTRKDVGVSRITYKGELTSKCKKVLTDYLSTGDNLNTIAEAMNVESENLPTLVAGQTASPN